jgi:HTH-type transcriptional regulator, sugar sensing transcriptional regulator
MKLSKELQRIGLDHKEADIYLAALELGQTDISRLAKKAGIKRTTAYLVAESLKRRGLLNSFKKGKRPVFYAEDPRILLEQLDERKTLIAGFLPRLLSQSNLIDKKPVIRFYEGEEGIREIYKDTLRFPGNEQLAIYPESSIHYVGAEYWSGYYAPKRLKLRIPVRNLYPDNPAMRKYRESISGQLQRTKFVDEKLFAVEMEFLIYGDRQVALLSFEEEIGLIIESRRIQQGLRSMFETIWALAPGHEYR